MSRVELSFQRVSLLLLVGWAAVQTCPKLAAGVASALSDDPLPTLVAGGVSLLVRLIFGGAMLAWLPGGFRSTGGVRGLPASLAASLVLSSAVLAALGDPSPGLLLGAAGVLVLLRLPTLPAGLRPGPRASTTREGAAARIACVTVVSLAILQLAAGLSSEDEFHAATSSVALAALGSHTGARLGHDALSRRGLALLLLLSFPIVPLVAGVEGAELALLVGAAVACYLVRRTTADPAASCVTLAAALGAVLTLVLRRAELEPATVILPFAPAVVLTLGALALRPRRTTTRRLG